MGTLEIIGQILGFVTPVIAIISYQMKSQKNLLIWQIIASAVKGLSYLMLGAISGMALNMVGLVRNTVFFRRKLKGEMGKVIPIVFTVITVIVGIITWKEWYTVFNFSGMVIHAFCMSFSNSQKVRKSILITSPLVIIYDLFEQSYGSIVYESLAVASSIVGIVRHRNKNTE